MLRSRLRSRLRLAPVATAIAAALLTSAGAFAQLGQMISPGPLAKAHAHLEGVSNCVRCHEQGKQVPAARCLACHKEIGTRIAQRRGVHRNVKDDCVRCHVEHAGRDAELRPFDTKKFDHRAETRFPLDGRHALQCARCHRKRTFLDLVPRCASCHRDPHKPSLGAECATCHTTAAPFRESGRAFDHSRTFPLEGAHARVPCTKCHSGGKFRGLPHQSCTDCHRNPHRAVMGSDCRSCHTVAGWRVAEFDHARTGTPLRARHEDVACAKCHVRPPSQAALKMQPCGGCHKDPHAGQFAKDCAACHDERGFHGAAYDHSLTRFPLTGKHATLACASCHKRKGDFRGVKTECAACHADPHRGELRGTCQTCHTTASFKVRSFEHPRFPEFFGGGHAGVACEKCHQIDPRAPKPVGLFANVSTDCKSCHRDIHLGQLPDCQRCHSVDAPKFAASLFRHDAASFQLTGKHATVPCASCHKPESAGFPAGSGTADRYRGVARECRSCHKDVHAGDLGDACGTCHDTGTFRVASYTHLRPGPFFGGRHAAAKCAGCHRQLADEFPAGRTAGLTFTGTATNCAACHTDPHQGNLGTACQSCHEVAASWANASRAFHKAGLFPLEGRHLTTPCADCHQNGVIEGTPARCYDCHWIRRQDDRFHTALGNDCESCHRPIAWSAVLWDHDGRTGFPLGAAHAALSCDGCHRTQTFAAMQSDCGSCHMSDYSTAHEPNHQALGFPLVCQLCHRPSDPSWEQARFDHSGFALAGQHQTATCQSCHRDGLYQGTARDCATCHRADFEGSSDPNHTAAGFTGGCDECHRFSDASWTDAGYAHKAWPPADTHHAAHCADCHSSNVYAGRPHDCASCHRAEYDTSKDPSHAAAGFPLTCELCHRGSDATWDQGTFDHSSFGLAGRHGAAACADCHRNGVYAGTSRLCSVCHLAEFNAAQEPNHVAAGFPDTCDTCHKFADASWDQGVFAHTVFPLAGVHLQQECLACHAGGVYAGTSRLCSGCHLDDYTASKEPNHAAAGFPDTCDTCHKFADLSWDQGTFSHTTFPLAGRHLQQVCLACHANGVYAGTPRSCAGCHLDDYNTTTDPSHAAAGFATACDSCHKFADSSWDQGAFAHDIFRLRGVHGTEPCSSCHAGGVYDGTPRTCAGCHLDDYNATNDPKHTAAGFPTTCDSCHRFTDTSWDQGVFDHDFPINSGDHAGEPCSSCHTNSSNFSGFVCTNCHTRGETDPEHDEVSGYVWSSAACYTCHPNGQAD